MFSRGQAQILIYRSVYVGRCPTPHQPFEKGWAKTFLAWVRLNFTSFWDEKRRGVFRQRKAYTPTKKARFLFGDVAFARPRPS